MPTSRIVLILFAFTSTINVKASADEPSSLFWATKPLLMPLLIGYLWFATRESGRWHDGQRLVVAALLFAALGDVALMIPGSAAFLVGMALFAGCHACYIAAFVRMAGRRALAGRPVVAALAYAGAVAAALAWLWPGLGALAVPMTGYAILLATMAATATAHGWRVGLGGALFFVSDLLIAVDVAGAAQMPGPPIWVMLTYVAGQALIITGWADREPRTARESLQQVAV